MHPNEPRLYWQAAMSARSLASRTDPAGTEAAMAAIDDLAGIAAVASDPIAGRAQSLLAHIERTAADTWIQITAGHALREAVACREGLDDH